MAPEPDPLADIEFFQRQLTNSLAVPAEAMKQFASSMAAISIAAESAAREMERFQSVVANVHDEIMHSFLGELLNPRSAVDRLADLVREETT